MDASSGDHRLRQWPCQGQLFNALPAGIVLQNVAGEIVAVNPAAERILGQTAQQMVGITSGDARWQAIRDDGSPFPADDHPAMVCLRTRQPVRPVVMGVHQPLMNRCAWLRIQAIPVFDEESAGSLLGVFTVFEDITETRETERRFRTLFEHSPLGIALVQQPEGRILKCNAAYARIIGRPIARVPGLRWQEITHPDDLQEGTIGVAGLLDGAESVYTAEKRILRPGGGEVWVRVIVAPTRLPTAQGGSTDFISIIQDISRERELQAQARQVREQADRLENEQRLRQVAEHLQLAVDAASLGTWSWDLSTDELVGSDTGLLQIGLPPGTVLDRHQVLDLIHPGDRTQVEEAFTRALQQPDHHEAVFRVQWPNGSERWIHAMGRARFGPDGRASALWGVTRDVTEQRQAEDERARARERERLLQKQVAIQTLQAMAHELHQPLQSVSSLNGLIQNQLRKAERLPSTVEPLVQLAIDQAVRAGGVLQELMDELELWDYDETRLKAHDLGTLVRKVVDRVTDHRRSLRVELDIAPGLPPVLCYDLQTEKILANLVGNAIEAMRDAGMADPRLQVRIGAQSMDGQRLAVVTVRDYGPGVDPARATQVFDPLFTTKSYGMGLGLAISRSLARAQGGDLELTPDCHPGAEFRFTVPFASEPPCPN